MMTFEITKHKGGFVKDNQVFCSQHAATLNCGGKKEQKGGVPEFSAVTTLWLNCLLVWKVIMNMMVEVLNCFSFSLTDFFHCLPHFNRICFSL